MKILDPVLAPDVSTWTDHIVPAEFSGCGSVVVGLYSAYDATGKKILAPKSLAQCQAVIKSNLLLQAYYWDDITYDPIQQADWVVKIIKDNNLPVKWVWADQEMYWTDWTAWSNWRMNPAKYPQPKAAPAANISSHNAAFMARLNSQFPSGVYTNNGFVASWASGMNAWLPKYKAWVAQYMGQPKEATPMTWDYLKAHYLPNYDIALAPGQLPQNVVGHQFTGDSCILPGSYNAQGQAMPLDVSMFSAAFLKTLGGVTPVPPPAPVPVPGPAYTAYITLNAVNVRSANSQTSPALGVMAANTTVYIDTYIPLQYSHFKATPAFPQGGFIATQYLKKV